MKLLNSQKRELFDLIKEIGYNPFHFELNEEPPDPREAILKRRGTDYVCKISYSPGMDGDGSWQLEMRPGAERWTEYDSASTWNADLITIVHNWLDRVDKEISTPDPWLALDKLTLPDSQVSEDSSNTPFSYAEWETVRDGVQDIRKLLLRDIKESKKASALVNKHLDKLIEDGKKFGRKDWFNLAYGTIAGIFVSIGTQPEIMRAAWELLKAAVSGIVPLTPVIADTVRHLT